MSGDEAHDAAVQDALRADPTYWIQAIPQPYDKAAIEAQWWAMHREIIRLHGIVAQLPNDPAHRPGGKNERDFMTDGNVNEGTGVRTAQAKPGSGAASGSADGPSKEDVGCWWLYRKEWGWQPVIVAYNSFIQPGDDFRHPIIPGMTWGGKISPPNDQAEPPAPKP